MLGCHLDLSVLEAEFAKVTSAWSTLPHYREKPAMIYLTLYILFLTPYLNIIANEGNINDF